MMLKARVCKLLGIEFPVIQAPMDWVTDPELKGIIKCRKRVKLLFQKRIL